MILRSWLNGMHASADLTGQANHLGVTIQADIIKQSRDRDGYLCCTLGLEAAHFTGDFVIHVLRPLLLRH